MKLDIYIVDAFTQNQFGGNSAAVVPLIEWLDDSTMQKIATQNNLSETAYIKRVDNNKYEIRWFSPLCEIDFCGHATLASSFIIFNKLGVKNIIEFQTLKVGSLFVSRKNDGRIEMSFPNQEPTIQSNPPQALLEGLSIKPKLVLKNRQAYFAVYNKEQEVQEVIYNSNELKKLAPFDTVITAESLEYDFVSRYFWPANGGDEDPVTGSIHTGLAPYWAKELGKTELKAYQASKRGGVLYCEIKEDRVLISGYGVMYLEGEINI